MNTEQNTQKKPAELPVTNLNPDEIIRSTIQLTAQNADDSLLVYEAKIITPHPYGVFALCKIYEHFQIN